MAMIDRMMGKAGMAGGGPGGPGAADRPGAGDPAALGESEGENTAVELLNNSIDDLTKLAALLPEADMFVKRLEALRGKAEAADQGGGPGSAMPSVGPGL